MKIGNPADKLAASAVQTPQTGAAAAADKAKQHQHGVAPTTPESSTHVALSSTATNLLTAANADFDANKVSRITQAIADGKFEINAEAIADKLLANAQEALSKVSH